MKLDELKQKLAQDPALLKLQAEYDTLVAAITKDKKALRERIKAGRKRMSEIRVQRQKLLHELHQIDRQIDAMLEQEYMPSPALRPVTKRLSARKRVLTSMYQRAAVSAAREAAESALNPNKRNDNV